MTTNQMPPSLLILGGWVYPGPPGCAALSEIADGRSIQVIKPEFLSLPDSGVLSPITDAQCNAYTDQNVAAVKANSTQQFVTVSGTIAGVQVLARNSAALTTCIHTILSFLQTTGFTGIEFDIENYSSWSSEQYQQYKDVMTAIGQAVHGVSAKMMLDGPAISNSKEQGYYLWRYEDFATLPIDYLVAMAYDNQFDTGAGGAVQPLAWLRDICGWMKEKLPINKIVIGIPSYGYHGKTGGYQITTDTYIQSTHFPGFKSATRDAASGEMMWVNNGISYDYSDTQTLDGKLKLVLSQGLFNVSVWHLGGNSWFSSQPSITPTPVKPSNDFTLAYPGFDAWYQTHFKNGVYHE